MILKNTTFENRWQQSSRKTPNFLGEWNGYPEMFSLSRASEISRQYLLLLSNCYFTERSR